MMQKDSYWFQHDSNASNDPKIVALIAMYGFEGYGRYWSLIELLRDQQGYKYSRESKFWLSSLADRLKMNSQECKVFIDHLVDEFELLQLDEKYLWSPALLRRMEPWDTKKRVLSERGRKGAEATNRKKSAQAKVNSGTSTAQVNDDGGNESIEHNNKEEKEDLFHIDFPIEDCLKKAMNDSRWINANKATGLELQEFNSLLEKRGVYEKNLSDYKEHFSNWKHKGKGEENIATPALVVVSKINHREQKGLDILNQVNG